MAPRVRDSKLAGVAEVPGALKEALRGAGVGVADGCAGAAAAGVPDGADWAVEAGAVVRGAAAQPLKASKPMRLTRRQDSAGRGGVLVVMREKNDGRTLMPKP